METPHELLQWYQAKQPEIEKRLQEFRHVWKRTDEEIFAELCFCILTPQSKAEACDEIIRTLKQNGLLFRGEAEDLKPLLKKTRFHKTKSGYIVEARRLFQKNGSVKIKDKVHPEDVFATREWLVENVRGIGYKEASHFLRNIGLGEDIAILDRHVLRALKRLGVLKDFPGSLTPKRYVSIERKVKKFADRIHIPLSHLDLLFWSVQANRIFK